ncbi:unnamed protein product [Arabis nemorensis]|uniref:Uncharacterized protein n=1 Tax=Arabis nemorensis TaxID=586526 RepID=A0A565BZN4_9BRAS|nr:unnamed protein product [Arabis nemorensis]
MLHHLQNGSSDGKSNDGSPTLEVWKQWHETTKEVNVVRSRDLNTQKVVDLSVRLEEQAELRWS